MPIELPNLDDLTYEGLVKEARDALPATYPAWTDHNPSDPGITLIELFAWITELIVYRTNRLTEPTERGFLKLLSGGAHGAEPDLEAAVEATIRSLRERYRAVTSTDYEELLRTAWPTSPQALELEQATPRASQIIRSRCVVERDLTAANKLAPAPGHASVIVMAALVASPWASPPSTFFKGVFDFLVARSLITTRLHVVAATPVQLRVRATIYLRDDAPSGGSDVRAAIVAAVVAHLHPWWGGASGRGWPFGRAIDVADIYAVMDEVAGVEFVEGLQLDVLDLSLGDRVLRDGENVIGIRLEAHELPRTEAQDVTLTLRERRGGVWTTIA